MGSDGENYSHLISFAEIRMVIQFEGTGRLPGFRGATLRGAFGFSLKRTVCHVRHTPCQECPVVRGCVYSCLFEGVAPPDRRIMRKYGNIPQPFVIIINKLDPPEVQEGQIYEFALRLFGQSVNHVPYIAFAIMQAGEEGLGKDKIPFSVKRVVQVESCGQERILFDETGPHISPAIPDTLEDFGFKAANGYRSLTVHFKTPIRYRTEGKLCLAPDFLPFLKAVIRRIRLMTYFYGVDIDGHWDLSKIFEQGKEIVLQDDSTEPFGFQRYSNRQKQKIPMRGLVGSVQYRGDFETIYPILKLAECTHVGKATSFGFGRIKIQLNR